MVNVARIGSANANVGRSARYLAQSLKEERQLNVNHALVEKKQLLMDAERVEKSLLNITHGLK